MTDPHDIFNYPFAVFINNKLLLEELKKDNPDFTKLGEILGIRVRVVDDLPESVGGVALLKDNKPEISIGGSLEWSCKVHVFFEELFHVLTNGFSAPRRYAGLYYRVDEKERLFEYCFSYTTERTGDFRNKIYSGILFAEYFGGIRITNPINIIFKVSEPPPNDALLLERITQKIYMVLRSYLNKIDIEIYEKKMELLSVFATILIDAFRPDFEQERNLKKKFLSGIVKVALEDYGKESLSKDKSLKIVTDEGLGWCNKCITNTTLFKTLADFESELDETFNIVYQGSIQTSESPLETSFRPKVR